ncbi:hypothetical protein [Bacillus chungangensis]|uniref:DUF1797 domain-containing protein n=1 Tax=Bacillus chungangensis TaxID=587633 RepID=A0ABT9WMH3_9BACI|nr:hypothetical protein [Bacillus chungangensis]MDQ0174432.1 hypothetical protein [Bacillus chungangensis]
MKIDDLIRHYEERLVLLQGSIDEINERYGDDFDVIDACGANYDDAYALGDEHGGIYAEYDAIKQFISDLKSLKEVD